MNQTNLVNQNDSFESALKTWQLGHHVLVIAVLVLMVLSFGSCSKEQNESGIRVKIKNVSNYDYSHITLQQKDFGNLKKGEESKYIVFDKVYLNLANVSLFIDEVEFKLLPIDYDSPELTSGSCVYLIGVENFQTRTLSLLTSGTN